MEREKKTKTTPTLQERLIFQDHDLALPAHDDIMLWLDKKLEELIAETVPCKWMRVEWLGKEGFYTTSAEKVSSEALGRNGPLPQHPGVKILKKTWECPVTGAGKQVAVVGFVDLYVEVANPYVRDAAGRWEIDERLRYRWAFEVKTTIRSLGELLRQIRMYQEYGVAKGEDSAWFVVSPDDRFATTLAEQGIKFLRYEP